MMKKSLYLMLGVSLLSASGLAVAKDKTTTKTVATTTTTVSDAVSSTPASTDLILREISKKQAELELKRINFEMQKMDLDIQDKLNKTKPTAPSGVASLPALSLPPPTVSAAPPVISAPKDNLSKYKIGSIYGFDGNLTAEIITPNGDTNIVKNGQVLGEGVTVSSITASSVTLRDKLNRDYVLGVSSLSSSASEGSSMSATGGFVRPPQVSSPAQGNQVESLGDFINNFNSKPQAPKQYNSSDYYK